MKTVWKSNMSGAMTVLDVGRNDDCPCGSHIKFKYCCIDSTGFPILGITGKRAVKRIKDGVLL